MRFKLAFLALLAVGFASPAMAASCYVSEFTRAADGGVQVATQPATVDQTAVAVSASSAQSAAFKSSTNLIRINCDVVVSFVVGTNPTATANNARLPTGVVEYFKVTGGQLIAFITNN